MTHVRVRFAPSPTGTLHIGSARSALFNWLYARHFGDDATYVLRIEDTDQERSTPEHVEQALAVFRWLGLDWDEGPGVGGPHGPYFQSERYGRYTERLGELRDSGHVYACFCTKEQLDADRAAAQAASKPFVYTGRCRDIAAADQQARIDAGEAYVLRFRVPGGTTVVNDLVLGEASFENELIGDFVVARADGSPLYNLANVIDDSDMAITHVIRGSEHLSNTPRQILLYEALGETIPQFAHLPLILAPEGGKLSKRKHHAAMVEVLAAEGYVPQALRNGLALLGWNRDESSDVMTTQELIEAFDVARVKKSPAVVDYTKLRHLNGMHLRMMSEAEFAEAFAAWRRDWLPEGDERREWADAVTPEQAAYLTKEKVEVLGDVPALVSFLVEPHEMAPEAWERLAKVEQAPQVLEAVVAGLEGLEEFTVESVEAFLRGLCTELELKPKFVFSPIRFAVTGRTITPGLWESIVSLGRERSLSRLRAALQRLQVTA